jgi:hypothetical protein
LKAGEDAIVFGWLPFIGDVLIEMGIVLWLQRDIDPFLSATNRASISFKAVRY